MELEKIPEGAVQVGSHWEWNFFGHTCHFWTDENGFLHREGAPARIEYLKDGIVDHESWYLHGVRHREGGPAKIKYRQDGTTISSEEWWLHGQRHREGGPALIDYLKNGTVDYDFWWLHGEDTEPIYPGKAYQEIQTQIGHPAMWGLPGNLIPLLSAFF